MKKLTITGAVVVAIALGAGGCGNDEPAETTKASTQADFIDQGDVILCAKTEAVDNAAASIDFEAASDSELKSFVFEGVLPAVQTAHDDLAAIPAPAGDEAQIDALLTAMSDGMETTESDPAQLITGPDPFAKADGLITDYGLSGCTA